MPRSQRFVAFSFFVPNLFTVLNLACGFLSIIMTWKQHYYFAGMLLILGSIFDSVDGRMARLLGAQSSFGEQLDSLSDLVSFGMAPACLVYHAFFQDFGRTGIIISFLFLLCGALRLARFNANLDRVDYRFFQGLPIPMGALSVIGLVFWQGQFSCFKSMAIFAGGYVVSTSFLMISNIPFPSFKDSPWLRNHRKQVWFLSILVLATLAIWEELMIGVFTNCYIWGSLIYFFGIKKGRFVDIFRWKNENV